MVAVAVPPPSGIVISILFWLVPRVRVGVAKVWERLNTKAVSNDSVVTAIAVKILKILGVSLVLENSL